MKTKEEIYNEIVEWEQEAGEDFVDYFDGHINEFNFMFWALGKGYITAEQFQAYEEERIPSTSYVLGDEEYSVVYEDHDNPDWETPYRKSREILADFFSSSATYQERLHNFFNRIHPMKFDDAINAFRFKREKIFYVLDGERTYLTNETELSVDLINKVRWYRDDN